MFKLKPYKRKGPRISYLRNDPCICGATKEIPNPNYQKNFEKEKPDKPVLLKYGQINVVDKFISVPKKYKECCLRKTWGETDKTVSESESSTPELDKLGL